MVELLAGLGAVVQVNLVSDVQGGQFCPPSGLTSMFTGVERAAVGSHCPPYVLLILSQWI
ncbi:hypothetical protein ROA7450_01564 [Roseovarius albus]|uniref:Uncharacterized protein n=1 Tax=Roseovarius albus TaxID=1247867 RepID=A0A1X6YXW3_9RHOB|nr:hypothetical protein ROA7450_01564 [Roseovarius albus]